MFSKTTDFRVSQIHRIMEINQLGIVTSEVAAACESLVIGVMWYAIYR